MADLTMIQKGQLTQDMTFQEKVWALTCRIPKGKVSTYGAIAHALGGKAYRAVGHALHCNPYAPKVPCHRVIAQNGRLAGFAKGASQKRYLLEVEGVVFRGTRVLISQCYHIL